MHAYRYDPTTREFLGACALVANPRRPGAPCLPAFSTLKPAPEPEDVSPEHTARFVDEDNGWEIVEDHRGVRYWLPGDDWTHAGREIAELGPLPEGATLTKPEMQEDVRLARAADAIRAERDRRLTACDYLMMPDYPLDSADRTAWSDYRQTLRDLPQHDGFPWSGSDDPAVPWPVEPS